MVSYLFAFLYSSSYGAPNTWHKKKHRGRKRCGMLFAMPSVRAKLGLSMRPASDPDVKAKRLVQVDADLAAVLYGTRDTMAAHYNRRPPPVVMRAAPPGRARSPSAPQPQPSAGKASRLCSLQKKMRMPARM